MQHTTDSHTMYVLLPDSHSMYVLLPDSHTMYLLLPDSHTMYVLLPDSQVALAVQLEDGTRKQGTFPSTSTLWSVLSELGIAAGQDEAKEPIIVFMRREVGVVWT